MCWNSLAYCYRTESQAIASLVSQDLNEQHVLFIIQQSTSYCTLPLFSRLGWDEILFPPGCEFIINDSVQRGSQWIVQMKQCVPQEYNLIGDTHNVSLAVLKIS